MLELNKIYCMDNVQGMKQLDNESVDLVVTSPPYDNLRNYNGFSFNLDGMITELLRIVKRGGKLCGLLVMQPLTVAKQEHRLDKH